MTINLKIPDIRELKPRITVFGVGGAGGNAVNNMITAGLQGVDFVVANTDAQALTMSKAERIIQMGVQVTEGLGAGSQPDVGRAAAEEVIDEIRDHLSGAHMVFVTAGMGGGTGTGAAPIIAKAAREVGILTVGVVTKPFHFEGQRRMRIAENGIIELQKCVDTLLIIPNQNLFRVANEKTTFADAFAMADQVLYSGVACITDLMVKEGLINLDFADVRAVMREMGKAMMGTGEAEGDKRALTAAEAAIANPLIDDASMKGAKRAADLDHRRPRPHPLRSRRGGNPHPRGGRPGRQHHRRRDLRRGPRRHHPRLGRRHRHRPALSRRTAAGGGGRIAHRRGGAAPARRQPARRRAHRACRAGAARPLAAPGRGARFGQRVDRIGGKAAVAAAIMPPDAAKRSPFGRSRPSRRCSSIRPASGPEAQSRRPSFRRSRSGCRRAPRMPRVDELPVPAQNEIRARRGELRRRSIRKSGACRCCSGWRRSASVAAKPSMSTHRGAGQPSRAARLWALRSRRERLPGRPLPPRAEPRRTRSRNTPSARRRRGSTTTAGRHLCHSQGGPVRHPGLPAPAGELSALRRGRTAAARRGTAAAAPARCASE